MRGHFVPATAFSVPRVALNALCYAMKIRTQIFPRARLCTNSLSLTRCDIALFSARSWIWDTMMRASGPLRLQVCIALLCCSVCVTTWAQGTGNFVYTDDDAISNTVSAFSVSSTGALTEIVGSPFATGGVGSKGGYYAADRATIRTIGNFLYVSNSASGDVSALTINPQTGSLALVSGSPFPAGGSASGYGISLAVTPNNNFLIAANAVSNTIWVFTVNSNGSLSPITGSPFYTISSPDGIKVSPNGSFLAVALPSTSAVEMFAINTTTGALTEIGSFPSGAGQELSGIDINSASTLLFAGEANQSETIVDVYDISTDGVLTPITGSPFIATPSTTPGAGQIRMLCS
jgi:hypothetical protein